MWTDAATDRAKALFGEKLSNSQIARQLNTEFGTTFTRNAVVGKLHRLGYQCAPGTRKARAASARRPTHYGVRKPGKQHRAVFGQPSGGVTLKRTAIPVPIAPSLEFKVSFFDLGPRNCRYPLWAEDDPPLHEKFFCGAVSPEGETYCRWHHSHTHNGFSAR